MLFYLFVILFASALAQAAPTESAITDLKGVIEKVTTLRPLTVNETVYSDAKAFQALGSPLESVGTSRNVSREIIPGSLEASRATNITDTDTIILVDTVTPIGEPIVSALKTNAVGETIINTTEIPQASTTTSNGITTTLRPKIITDLPTTESQMSSTIARTVNKEISTLTSKITTESFIVSTTPIEFTAHNVTTTLMPEMITDAPITETEISITTTPTTNDELSIFTPETTIKSFFMSTTPNELTKDNTNTTITPEIITDAPTVDDKIGIVIPEITTESFIALKTPFESITDGVFSTLTPESFPALTTPIESTTNGIATTLKFETTTGAPTLAFEAINTTLNPATIGVISTSSLETPITEETAVQNDENTTTACIFYTSQFILKDETPEYCYCYQINCKNYLNHQSFCTYSLVGECNNFKAYQIGPIEQLVRSFTYFPYTFNYQYIYKEQRSYGCNLYRVKCEHHCFVNIKTEHCNYEYVGKCSNYQMIHVINSSFY
ncbi:uncharacterized protein LOC141528148 isoform X2 [Cotesia typhae]|uniref:uncharacterized protein LOC141528148 isoform X2 n=1 Tax=Cotesia typhae TaxID=2053667 RepID=UPI003D685602